MAPNFFFFSSIFTLAISVLLLNVQVQYDVTLLPPFYNGVYVNKLTLNGSCMIRNETYVYNGVFQVLEHICALREDIELNILNCYDSSHAFLMNFKLFKYTTYVMYIEIVLIVIIIVLCILIPFVQKWHFVILENILLPIWVLSYFLAKLIVVLNIILYISFRWKLSNSSHDPMPRTLTILLLATAVALSILNIFDFIAGILDSYLDEKKRREDRANRYQALR